MCLLVDVAAAMRADQRIATNGAVPVDSEAATATVSFLRFARLLSLSRLYIRGLI